MSLKGILRLHARTKECGSKYFKGRRSTRGEQYNRLCWKVVRESAELTLRINHPISRRPRESGQDGSAQRAKRGPEKGEETKYFCCRILLIFVCSLAQLVSGRSGNRKQKGANINCASSTALIFFLFLKSW